MNGPQLAAPVRQGLPHYRSYLSGVSSVSDLLAINNFCNSHTIVRKAADSQSHVFTANSLAQCKGDSAHSRYLQVGDWPCGVNSAPQLRLESVHRPVQAGADVAQRLMGLRLSSAVPP